MNPKPDATSTRVTRSSSRHGGASVVPTPATGVSEDIPVVGTIIDYDYARAVGTVMEKTSVRFLSN